MDGLDGGTHSLTHSVSQSSEEKKQAKEEEEEEKETSTIHARDFFYSMNQR